MLHRSFKPAKCKTALKLATSRIKLMKNKRENHLTQLKRELAKLLELGQDQTARIRVEHVVREEKTIAAYDLLDIYCELIVARLPIIDSQKSCPIDLKEAVASVVFASPRCADIPELQDVRKHFIAKYGKEFVNGAIELRPDSGVSRMLVEKLSATAPDGQTKLKILSAIAEEHSVVWDPKTFGEKESKPYDDLLKGPGQMFTEPPIVQTPPPPANVHVPQGLNQNHNHQQNSHSSSSHYYGTSDFSGGQSAQSSAPRPPVRPSEAEYEGTETRHSQSRNDNSFSSSGQNWNMEFKDATAAAQAAAESAERASMAARAAAELASYGKMTRQHSSESQKSNFDGLRDDRPRRNYESPSEKFVKDADYNSPHNRKQVDGYVPETHSSDDERVYKEDRGSAKRYNPSASSKSKTTSVSVDDKRPVNDFQEVNKYSRQSSFDEVAVKPVSGPSLPGSRVSKQFGGGHGYNHSRSSSSNDGDYYNNSPSHQNFVFDDSKDPFDNAKSHRATVESGDIGTTEAIFDSYLSDHDIIKFDKQPQYDEEQESNFYSASIGREPSNKVTENIDQRSSWENKSSFSEKPLSASRVSADLFTPPLFDESLPKASRVAHPDDLAPPTFDDYGVPGSDTEDEPTRSSIHGKSDVGTNIIYDDVPSPRSSSDRRNSKNSSNEKSHRLSPQSSRLSSHNEGKVTYDVSAPASDYTMESEVFDQSSSESGNMLKLPALTGGIRNKGYKIPPYRKSPSGDSLPLPKDAAEDIPTYTQNPPAPPRVEGSSLKSSVEPKVKDSLSSKTRFENYNLGTDDSDEELPQLNLRSKQEKYAKKEISSPKTGIKSYDLEINDVEEDLLKPKLASKQEKKEDYSKSKFSAPAGFFSPDDDSEDDFPKQTVTSKVRAGSGYSRRTKANPDSETSSYTKSRRGSGESAKPVSENKPVVSENKPKTRPQPEKHSATRPEEKRKPLAVEQPSSPLKTATSSGVEPPSRESSLTKASHVHPKLPDYDSFAAHFQSLRQNRD